MTLCWHHDGLDDTPAAPLESAVQPLATHRLHVTRRCFRPPGRPLGPPPPRPSGLPTTPLPARRFDMYRAASGGTRARQGGGAFHCGSQSAAQTEALGDHAEWAWPRGTSRPAKR